ncbi:hypothetical protein U3516DRAFT_659414 [Neocallimastix sp. 'constans']
MEKVENNEERFGFILAGTLEEAIQVISNKAFQEDKYLTLEEREIYEKVGYEEPTTIEDVCEIAEKVERIKAERRSLQKNKRNNNSLMNSTNYGYRINSNFNRLKNNYNPFLTNNLPNGNNNLHNDMRGNANNNKFNNNNSSNNFYNYNNYNNIITLP